MIELRETLDRLARRVPVDDRLGEIVSHGHALRRDVEERPDTISLSPDEVAPPGRRVSGRRWPILTAAAAVVLLVGALVLVTRDDGEREVPAGPPTGAGAEHGLIAFVGGSGESRSESDTEIYVVAPNGTGLRALTSTPGVSEMAPRWSPDGTRLAFLRNGRAGDLVVIDPSTGVETFSAVIPKGNYGVGPPMWSPDGRLIVFDVDNRPADWGPLVVDLDTGAWTHMSPGGFQGWSPDGRWFVLGQMDAGLDELDHGWPELFLVPADHFGRTDLDDVADLPGVRLLQRDAYFGAWMPDSSAVALTLDDGSIDVVTISDGQRRTLIEHGGLPGMSASWSPDGSRVAISVIDGATDPEVSIDVVTIADGQRRTLIEHGDAPSWSPDGSHIAYLECPTVGDPELLPRDTVPADMAAVDPRQADGVVWVAAADGTSARPVATSLEPPIWSPDGSVLIAVGEDGLFIVRPDGTGMTRLTQVMTPVEPWGSRACRGTHSFAPVWQPVPPSAETVADAVLPPVRVETTEPPETTAPLAITDG